MVLGERLELVFETQEFVSFDYRTLVETFPDRSGIIETLHFETKLPALNGYELNLCAHRHAYWRSCYVTNVDQCADRFLRYIEVRPKRFDARPLDKSHHKRGRKNWRHVGKTVNADATAGTVRCSSKRRLNV